MTQDLAELGFSFDSTPLAKGVKDIDRVTEAAGRGEKAADAYSKAQRQAMGSIGVASKDMDPYSRAVDKISGSIQKLNGTAEANAAAMARQRASLGASGAAADDFSKRAMAVVRSLEFERAQLERTSAEQERYAAIRRAGVAVDSAAGLAISASVQKLQAQREALASTTGPIEQYRATWEKVRHTLEVVGVMLIADRLIEMAKSAIESAAGLDELSQQMGITAAGLQALQFSAVQSGTKLEQLETGISKFSEKMGEAAGGSKEMIDALNNIGVKILDTRGNLLATEINLQNVAIGITNIQDPARQSAAAVDFFGKAGARMIPMLGDMAHGLDAMKGAAQRAGAMISDETIAKLDALADASERSQLKLRAMFAENAAGPLTTAIGTINDALSNTSRLLTTVTRDWKTLLLTLPLAMMSPGTIGAAIFGPTPLDAATKARDTALSTVTDMKANLAMAATDRDRERITRAMQKAQADADYNQVAILRLTAPKFGDSDMLDPVVVNGDRNPPPKTSGGGESPEAKYAQLVKQLTLTAAAQDKMTASARAGDVAFAAQQATVDAQNKVLEIFKTQLADTDPRLTRVRDLLLDVAQGKAAQSFAVATTELQNQNVILEAQIRLMNEGPEIQAREIALIKTRQEAEKAGGKLSQEELDRRYDAIAAGERLKNQAEDLRRAQDLWTAPLKSAFESIQKSAADAWENILQTGNLSFQSLADVFKSTLRRMAAEFLALATIRPVMTLAIEAIGPGGIGLIGGSTMSQLGVSTGAGGASAGGGLGSIFGGGSSLFSSGGATGGGWLARQFSGIGDWLGSPIGGFGGALNTSSPAAAAAPNGATGASLGGLTWGSALGGAASIGMGAYGLLKGGGNTASTIGSIGQMVGGGLMFVPGLQPVGAAISLLSGILPGLFGDSGPKIPPQPALAYGSGQFRPTGAGGYTYGGDSLGSGTAMTAGAQTLATSLTTAFRAAGLAVVPSALIGGNIASGTDHTLQGQQWQDRPYTQTGLLLPGGGYEALTSNDSSRNPDQASEYLLAQAFKANVLRGGVTGAGAGLKAGLETINPITSADLDRVVSLGTAYDRLGKTLDPAKDAIDKISASFDDMKTFATQAGLSLDPINAELAKQSKRSAQDFIDAMLNPLAVQMRALDDAKDQALASAEFIRDNIKDVAVDTNAIVAFYGKQRVALEDQYYGGAISNLKAMIASLEPGGNLANVDPTSQLAGLKSIYETTLAGARRNDLESIANLATAAGNYAQYDQSYSGGDASYARLRDQIKAELEGVNASLQSGGDAPTTGGNGSADSETKNMVKDNITATQATQAQLDDLTGKFDTLITSQKALTNMLSRNQTTNSGDIHAIVQAIKSIR